MSAPRDDRARSFGAVAQEYDRLRPVAASAALDWLLATLPPGGTVLDLAAGTGLLTRALRERGHAVVAVEPDERMRAVLAARSPEVAALEGSAEALPLPDTSVDAVLAASAWHWFDPERAVPEIARVLRPGGPLGLLWSHADPDAPWVEAVRAVGRSDRDGSAALLRNRLDVQLPPGSPFAPGEGRAFHRRAPMSRDDVAGMVVTYSGTLTVPAERRATIREQARALLDARPELGDADPLDVPFRTLAWRALRA